jgi:hypothetical protein
VGNGTAERFEPMPVDALDSGRSSIWPNDHAALDGVDGLDGGLGSPGFETQMGSLTDVFGLLIFYSIHSIHSIHTH